MEEIHDVLKAADQLQKFCVARGWKFCFIGGIAVQKWSEPRVTTDADITLLTGFSNERIFIDELLTEFRPRREDAAEFAERARVLLLKTDEEVGIDVALGGFPFEERAVSRAKDVEMLPGQFLRVCTAEDLIVFKVFAARGKDWNDVEMTIVRQGDGNLDWGYIHKELAPLVELKEQPELLDQLAQLRARLKAEG
jgi:hypothetical protein